MSDTLMERDGVRTEVHPGSVAIMQGLGWSVVDGAKPSTPSASERPMVMSEGESVFTPAQEAVLYKPHAFIRAEEPPPLAKVETLLTIPTDWRDLSWPERRSLASALTDEPVKNGADAERVISAAEARQG